MSTPLVSIIVPTRNSSGFLKDCLQSIREQSYQNIETIVVDNSSSDKTAEIAGTFTDKLYIQGPERSTQRNFGVNKSNGGYVFIVDSDMVLTSGVVSQCVEAVESDQQVKQLIVPEISEGTGFWSKVKAFERSFYIGDESIEAARFFDKKIFVDLSGYDDCIKGGGEEYDLPERILKAGHKQSRIKALIKHQEGHLTLLETVKTKYYYGKTARFYFKKQPDNARNKIKIFRPAFFRERKRLIKHPILASGMFFMKTCELGAGGVAYLISLLRA